MNPRSGSINVATAAWKAALHRNAVQERFDGVDHLGAVFLQRERQHAVRGELDVRVFADQFEELVRVDLGLLGELDHAAGAFADDGDDAEALGELLDLHEAEEVLDVRRESAEAVAHLVADVFEPVGRLRRGDLLVEGHADVLVADVRLGDVDVDAEVHRGLDLLLDALPLHLADGLLEHLRVHLEADGGDLAGLLAAEDVARAADLEVLGGDAEAGAEVGELLDGGQALACVRAQHAVAGDEKIAERQPVAASDAPAELVELREPEALGVVDENGVAGRDVDAVLDDGRGQEDVELALDEGEHDALQLALVHLAVADGDAQSGDELLQVLLHGVDRFDPVVNEEDLPPAPDLELDGLGDEVVLERHDGGLDGQAVLRRRFDHADVADADERHV